MATQAELMQQALDQMKKAEWNPTKWAEAIQNGYPKPGDPYNYPVTPNFKAQELLWQAAHASPSPSPGSGLADAQARMFLAQEPLDCLQAPTHMIPVCTADPGYAHYYTESVVAQLRQRFALVEAWCDCRDEGTPYSVADQMVRDLQLDGAWGQCENAAEFDHAHEAGATRMIGQLSGLREDQKALIKVDGIHLAFELYRNVMPWQVPDYETCTSGVGGNAIGCYASETEGAVYTPVTTYKGLGYYVSGRDSVYAVGLHPEDWKAL